MIVATFYHGDDDSALAWKQHDVYHDALAIIVDRCNRYAAFAKAVLNDTDHENWGRVFSFDHRTLQNAHDLLAAAWRFENDFRQGWLAFEIDQPAIRPEALWLDWLHAEVAAWIDHPHLVRTVHLILANQNQPTGYAAEARLCLDIIERFANVPWQTIWPATYKMRLAKSHKS